MQSDLHIKDCYIQWSLETHVNQLATSRRMPTFIIWSPIFQAIWTIRSRTTLLVPFPWTTVDVDLILHFRHDPSETIYTTTCMCTCTCTCIWWPSYTNTLTLTDIQVKQMQSGCDRTQFTSFIHTFMELPLYRRLWHISLHICSLGECGNCC